MGANHPLCVEFDANNQGLSCATRCTMTQRCGEIFSSATHQWCDIAGDKHADHALCGPTWWHAVRAHPWPSRTTARQSATPVSGSSTAARLAARLHIHAPHSGAGWALFSTPSQRCGRGVVFDAAAVFRRSAASCLSDGFGLVVDLSGNYCLRVGLREKAATTVWQRSDGQAIWSGVSQS